MSRTNLIFNPQASLPSPIQTEKKSTSASSAPSSPHSAGMFKLFPSVRTIVGFGKDQQIFEPNPLAFK